MATANKSSKKKNKQKAIPKIPYHRKPDNLNINEWQAALRKQFAETRNFQIKKVSPGYVFADYQVYNPESNNTYKVAIRSAEPGINFCSCMDFKTNLLGTCKHIEFILKSIKANPRSERVLNKGFQPHYTSVFLQYGKTRNVCIRIGTEAEKEFKKLAANYFNQSGVITDSGIQNIDEFLSKAHSIHPDFRCYPDALEFILDLRSKEQNKRIVRKALQQPQAFFKKLLKVELFPYQKEGVVFALNTGRCLIADDMGLGKTIQAIGAAEGMRDLFKISKVLVVCPTSLKYQWKSEIEKFTKSDFTVIEGNMAKRVEQYNDNTFYKICSYNVVVRDIDIINKSEFDLIILDEAQRIKNWQTNISRSVKKVRSKYICVLTGTPIENKLEELYSLVQVVDPYRLGALFRFVTDHQQTDMETGRIVGYKGLNEIGKSLSDILIRRHKKEVLKQLPSRMDKNLFVPMTEQQREYYTDAENCVKKIAAKWARFKFLNEKDRQILLINLNLMRMVCDSTYVVDEKTRFDTKIEELMNILDEVFENNTEKVVIFSQWERMTRLVAAELDERKIKYENLNGNVPSKEREQLFKNFNNDPQSKVFLSTDAGGVGLNLQAGSILINLDLPWNPAVLEQRISRIHRMGQKRNVQIINLITANSIEEQMLNRLKFKSLMAAGILDNGEDVVFMGEGKLSQLMKQVQELTENSPVKPDISEPADANNFEKNPIEETKKSSVPAFFDDEQIKSQFKEDGRQIAEKDKGSLTGSTNELFHSGQDFFGKLMETLANKEKTEELLKTIIHTDDKSGESFLKIPIKNASVIENGLIILGRIFSGK